MSQYLDGGRSHLLGKFAHLGLMRVGGSISDPWISGAHTTKCEQAILFGAL
jgi:hypothetical protein